MRRCSRAVSGNPISPSESLSAPRPSGKRPRACCLCPPGCGDETSSLVRHFFFGYLEAVSARVFRTVKRRIRPRDQGLKCRDRLVGNSGADADRGTNGAIGEGRARKLKARSHAFADFAGALEASRNDRDKLFTPEPGDDVVGTRARAHHPSKHAQDLVAHGVPETVIDRFEMIKIEHQ